MTKEEIETYAKARAERSCNGGYPITRERKTDVHYTTQDFIDGALWYASQSQTSKVEGLSETKSAEEILHKYTQRVGAGIVDYKNAALKAMEEFAAQFKSPSVVEQKLQAFKDYVHDRLDKMGIPSDPEPENNASHGCRIEGRLNFIEKHLSDQHP